MKVLHFVPVLHTSSQACQLIADALMGGEGGVEYHVVTLQMGGGVDLHGCTVHRLPRWSGLLGLGRKRYRRLLQTVRPDVVHIHSLWHIAAFSIYCWSREERVPVVLSPHKDAMVWNYSHHYLLSKLPKMLLFGRRMMRGASALHAITGQERQVLQGVSMHPRIKNSEPWNSRIALIPLATRTLNGISYHVTAEALRRLYRKVADSAPFSLMDERLRHVEDVLLQTGIAAQTGDRCPEPEGVRDINAEEWRLIQLHSHDQGVLMLVVKGMRTICPERRELDVQSVERDVTPRAAIFLDTARAAIKEIGMRQLADDYQQYAVERKICVMLLNLKHNLNRGVASRKNIVDFYMVLRYEPFNDYVLEDMLQELGVAKFMRRMESVMAHTLGLTEGYMPLRPLDDRGTRKIRNNLFKSDTQ